MPVDQPGIRIQPSPGERRDLGPALPGLAEAPGGTAPGPMELTRCYDVVEERLVRLFRRWGYRRLRTPVWEDAADASPALPETVLCRFIDPAGRVLALRADHTHAVARWVAGSGRPEASHRLYYVDPVYRRDPRAGRFTAIHQAGVELIGVGAPWGDVEVMAMLLEALDDLGLPEARVVVGHTGLLHQLLAEAGLDDPLRSQVAAALAARDRVTLRRLLAARLPEEQAGAWYELLTGGRTLVEAAQLLRRWTGQAEPFAQVLEALERFVPAGRIRVELGLARDLRYYTGLVFEAYAGTGRIAAGGRYDTLLQRLGGDPGPAIGFAFDLDRLAAACGAVAGLDPIEYLVAGTDEAALWREAAELRRRGFSAVVAAGLQTEEQALAAARVQGCRQLVWVEPSRRVARPLDSSS